MYQSGDGASVIDIQIDAARAPSHDVDPSPSILFPDKDLLFSADFRRLGADLLLVGHDAKAIVVDYFKSERRPNIMTREGTLLTGETVEMLAGPDSPGQYAQATNAAATRTSIGRVEKVSGSAIIIRNGISIELHVGDMVAKGDVVQTGANSALTIKFNDGTVFSLSSSARMVLNDMIYAADSNTNSALFTLVQGVIGFVAGRIAKTGDLKVDTPVATMAIRGTAVQTEIAAFSGTTRFSLLTEPDGTVGSFLLFDKADPSRVLTSISDARISTLLTPVTGSEPRITQIVKTRDEIRGEGNLVRDLFEVFSPEPRQRRGGSDFEDAPVIPVKLPQRPEPPDPSQFALVPADREQNTPREVIVQLLSVFPAVIRGSAIEDGPLTRLGALTGVEMSADTVHPVVIVPKSLPAGVRYLASSQSFFLDPAHPDYQKLGEGETRIVNVDYVLLDDNGISIPAAVLWTVVGRNDAPVAVSDSIVDTSERGVEFLALRNNDRDVDGNPLRIVRWTEPLEGSVFQSASGDLVFDPEDDFRALSLGETATVSFTYTLSDTKGAVDTANVTLQIQGTGTFSSPQQTALDSDILGFNGQSVSLTIDAPSATTRTTANLDLAIDLGAVLQPQMNIIYLIDISGSTAERFAGESIGDPNGDGVADTILDAEIAGLIALTERIRGLGFSPADVTVTVIPFNGSADPADPIDEGVVAAATFSLGQVGDAAIASHLRGLSAGGETNFADALRAANDKLQELDQGNEKNFVYFLSDGNGQGSIEAELSTLNNRYGARITALGIGENASLAQLDDIDNTNGASRLTSTDQIDTSVLGSPLRSGTVIDLDIFVNGRDIIEIGPEDLVVTPSGLALSTSIGELRRLAGEGNAVSATVTFASGETLITDLTITGALPRSTDHIL